MAIEVHDEDMTPKLILPLSSLFHHQPLVIQLDSPDPYPAVFAGCTVYTDGLIHGKSSLPGFKPDKHSRCSQTT